MNIEAMAVAVAKWAATEPLIRKVYLFGSRVRGDHRPDSDLDVAVEISTLQGDSDPFTTWTCEKQRLKSSLNGIVSVPIDLDWYGGDIETPRMHQAIGRSSVVVYEIENSTSSIGPPGQGGSATPAGGAIS